MGDGDLTSPSGPGIDAAGLCASGLLLCWLHRQRLEGGVIGLAGGLQGQDELGDPFVEPGPRPLPDLVGGDIGSEHRIQSSSPCDMRPPPPSQPSLPDGVQEARSTPAPSCPPLLSLEILGRDTRGGRRSWAGHSLVLAVVLESFLGGGHPCAGHRQAGAQSEPQIRIKGRDCSEVPEPLTSASENIKCSVISFLMKEMPSGYL